MSGNFFIILGIIIGITAIMYGLSIIIHELGHLLAHKRVLDTDVRFYFSYCETPFNEAIRHSVGEDIMILKAGYRANLYVAIISLVLGLSICPNILHINTYIFVSLLSVFVSGFILNMIGFILNAGFIDDNPETDGNKIDAIKRMSVIYDNNPTIKNKLLLKITQLQGDYKKRGVNVMIRDNVAYTYIYDDEDNTKIISEALLIFNKDTDSFKIYIRDEDETSEGFDEVFTKFKQDEDNRLRKIGLIFKEDTY